MKQVTVKRVISLIGNPFFKVQVNGETHSIIAFKIDVPEDDIYNEGKNKEAVMKLVEQLEKGNESSEEVIYQTPTN